MLPKRNKLTKKAFQEAFLTAKTVGNSHFTLKFKGYSGNSSLCAAVVSKSVAKKAHDRNAIKRMVYKSLQNNIKMVKNPYILMFFTKKDTKNATYGEINSAVIDVMGKIKPPLFQ